jgi:hypothetical protein
LIAQSTSIVGGVYVFASSVTLQSDTQYWFYAGSAGQNSGSGSFQAPGTTLYNGSTGSFQALGGQTANHRLFVVAAVAAPEPSALALLGVGIGIVGLIARRRRG